MPETPAVTSVLVQMDGLRLHCLKAGSGPAVVLVHGLVGSAQNWDLNLTALAGRHTVYALDLPFMGDSHAVPGGPVADVDAGLEASSDRLAGWMDRLEVETADWVGCSQGAAQVMMLAARHPRRVRRMVLFAPANPFCGRSRPLIAFYNSWVGSRLARLIPYTPTFAQRMAHARVYGDRSKVREEALASYTRSLNPAGVGHTLGIVRAWEADMARLRERLPEIARVPALLVWGDRDGVVGLESGRELAGALGAPLEVIAGAGHLAFTEEPERANALMLGWFGE